MTDLDAATGPARGILLYGPPRSLRGRLANLVRRIIGDDEQDELYAAMEPIPPPWDPEILAAETLTIRVTPTGTFEVLVGPVEEIIGELYPEESDDGHPGPPLAG